MECHDCGEHCSDLERVKVGRKLLGLCEDCAELRREQAEIGDQAQEAMREMMEYKS